MDSCTIVEENLAQLESFSVCFNDNVVSASAATYLAFNMRMNSNGRSIHSYLVESEDVHVLWYFYRHYAMWFTISTYSSLHASFLMI